MDLWAVRKLTTRVNVSFLNGEKRQIHWRYKSRQIDEIYREDNNNNKSEYVKHP